VKSFLHRQVWQRLPRSWRRRALFGASAWAAPRVAPNAKPALPIIVAGPLRTASGIGETARLCHSALAAAGLPVYGLDLTTALMQELDFPGYRFENAGGLRGSGTIILHVNSPMVPIAMLRLGRDFLHGKHVIGYWAWELPAAPSEWRLGVPFVHDIWVPSRFTADALSTLAAGRSVHVVPPPVAIDVTPTNLMERDATRPFTVLTIFNMASSFARKNPCATISAFRSAFGDDPHARLIIKLANMSTYPQGLELIEAAIAEVKNITLVGASLEKSALNALYSDADVLISLHRSEGFGLTLAEAMLRGLPVIATNWSGNVDFLTDDTGIPVPYRVVSAQDPQGTYQHPELCWADADIEAAAAALRRLRADPALRRKLGEAAAAFGAKAWGGVAYAATARRHLGL
jgi:glycosyltransferase involved in cell wall biosynthesis